MTAARRRIATLTNIQALVSCRLRVLEDIQARGSLNNLSTTDQVQWLRSLLTMLSLIVAGYDDPP